MARLREFDIDEVMEAVINAFWERGYEATSLTNLMEVTGLQKGSIYKAFGDKRSLFLKALQAYLDRNYSLMRQMLDNPSPKSAISAWFQLLSGVAAALEVNKGCFAVNSLLEMAPRDPEVAKMLEYQYSRIGKLLESAIAKGQKKGRRFPPRFVCPTVTANPADYRQRHVGFRSSYVSQTRSAV
jgi:TetR/AcrR family transcriptional regulator, transcriptional repressor for nem operon